MTFTKVGLKEMLAAGTYEREATREERTEIVAASPHNHWGPGWCEESARLTDGRFLVCLHVPGFPGTDVTPPDGVEAIWYLVTP